MKANAMNSMTREPDVTPQEAAAYWIMRAQSGDFTAADRAELDAWLAADARHPHIYESVRRTWDFTGAVAAEPEIMARREDARAALTPARASRWRIGAAFAATVLVAAGAAWFVHTHQGGARIYETEFGERSTVRLADGSVLTLNTDSRVAVEQGESLRSAVLERGQALFEVAADPRRPFVVTAGGRRITALGTAFDVRLEGDTVRVTLLQGSVAVDRAAAHPAPIILSPGEQFVAQPRGAPVVRSIDTARVASWREGRIIFENEPLASAVAEMNRYSDTRIVLEDPRLETFRVSGVFSTGEPARFLDALTVAFPITAVPEDGPAGPSVRLVWRGGQD